jgi:hypothetical protein
MILVNLRHALDRVCNQHMKFVASGHIHKQSDIKTYNDKQCNTKLAFNGRRIFVVIRSPLKRRRLSKEENEFLHVITAHIDRVKTEAG